MPDSRSALIRLSVTISLLFFLAVAVFASENQAVVAVRVARRMPVEGQAPQEWTGEKRFLDPLTVRAGEPRSEERRVGKECRL